MLLYTSSILRALRKYYGIGQLEMAKIIGSRQGTVSKLEAGVLELSAHQWISLCQNFNLDPLSLHTGRIEALDNLEINPHTSVIPGRFKISPRYQHLMASTVRTAYPLIKYMEKKIGRVKLIAFMKEKNIDPDYFIIQNLPLNIRVIEDIFLYLTKKGFLNPRTATEILDIAPPSELHQYMLLKLNHINKAETKFKRITKEISTLYEQNNSYIFEGDKKCFVKIEDNLHLKELSLSSEFNQFRKIYILSHFNNISPCLSLHTQFTASKGLNKWGLEIA